MPINKNESKPAIGKHSGKMLLWGLRDDVLHFIEDVENGLACNCICTYCNEPLIARNKGEVRTHSFAHHSGADCPGAIESVVHKLAKQVFAKTKTILLPPCIGQGPLGSKEYIKKTTITFDKIDLEKSIKEGDILIRPDAIGIINQEQLFVEFHFKHEIDNFKIKYIKHLNISCVEIKLYPELQEPGKMQKFLHKSIDCKKWIHNKKLNQLIYHDYLEEKKASEARLRQYLDEAEKIERKRKKEEDEWLRNAINKGNLYTTCPATEDFVNFFLQTKWGNNEIIKKIVSGNWNMGRIFNNWPSEPIDIFINEKQYILRPRKTDYDKLQINERLYYDNLLESVIRYTKLIDYLNCNPCIHCKMFVESKYEQILCKYKLGTKINNCLDYDSIF